MAASRLSSPLVWSNFRLNANLDLIVSGTALLRALKQAAGKADDHLSLGTVEDVQETFAYFHGRGSAAERVMTSAAVFKEIVQTADKLDKKKVRTIVHFRKQRREMNGVAAQKNKCVVYLQMVLLYNAHLQVVILGNDRSLS